MLNSENTDAVSNIKCERMILKLIFCRVKGASSFFKFAVNCELLSSDQKIFH